MPVAYRGGAAANVGQTANNSTVPFVVPAAAVVGDLMVVSILGNATTATYTPPTPASGPAWALRTGSPLAQGTVLVVNVWTKLVVAGEPGATLTWNLTNSSRNQGVMNVFSGADAVEASSTAVVTTAGTAHAAPAVTSVTANAWVMNIWTVRVATATSPGITVPASHTLRQTSNSAFTVSPNFRMSTGTLTANANTVGSYGPYTATASASATGAHFSLVIRSTPAAAPVSVTPDPVAVTPVPSDPAVTQIVAVTPDPVAVTPAVEQPAVTVVVVYAVTPAEISLTPFPFDSPAVTQTHQAAPAPLTGGSTADPAGVTQTHQAAPDPLAGPSSTDPAPVALVITATPDPLAGGSTTDPAPVTQAHQTAPDPVAAGSSTDPAAVTQTHLAAPDPVAGSSTADPAGVTGTHQTAPDSPAVTPNADPAAVSATYTVAPAPVTGPSAAEQPVVVPPGTLTPDGLIVAPAATSPTVAGTVTVTPDGLAVVPSAAGTAAAVTYTLTPDGVTTVPAPADPAVTILQGTAGREYDRSVRMVGPTVGRPAALAGPSGRAGGVALTTRPVATAGPDSARLGHDGPAGQTTHPTGPRS